MDQWLTNLQKAHGLAPTGGGNLDPPKIDSLLKTLLFDSLDDNSLAGNEILPAYDNDPVYADVRDPVSEFVTKRRDLSTAGKHDATAIVADVDDLEELLGYDDNQEDVEDSTKVASSETYIVDGRPLSKGEVASRMYRVLEQIRSFCRDKEAALIEKSIKALDLTAFAELAETVIRRMKAAA